MTWLPSQQGPREKYAKLVAAGTTVSSESMRAWREGPRDVREELHESGVQEIMRKLERKAMDSDGEQ